MALTLALFAGFVMIGIGLTIALLTLIDVCLRGPSVRRRAIDTRVLAVEALVHEPDSLAALAGARNVSQSA